MDTYKKLLHFSESKINPLLEKMGLPTHMKQIMNFEIIEFAIFSVVLTLFIIMACSSATLHFSGIHWLFLILFGLIGTTLSLPVQKNNFIARAKRKIFSFLPYYSFLEDSYYYRKEIIINELKKEEIQFALLEHIDLIIALYETYPDNHSKEIKQLQHYKKIFIKAIVNNEESKIFNYFIMLFPFIEKFKSSRCYQHLVLNEKYSNYKKNSLDSALSNNQLEEKEVEFEVGNTKEQLQQKMKEYL